MQNPNNAFGVPNVIILLMKAFKDLRGNKKMIPASVCSNPPLRFSFMGSAATTFRRGCDAAREPHDHSFFVAFAQKELAFLPGYCGYGIPSITIHFANPSFPCLGQFIWCVFMGKDTMEGQLKLMLF